MSEQPTRRILAWHNEQGIYVYAAFRPAIVQAAADGGTFGAGFGLDRMSWIKPSFGWMLHRSGYATKSRQEAIARIWLSHEGFQHILEQSVPTSFDRKIFDSQTQWATALAKSDVHYQWDPDRDLRDFKLTRRAIQIGLRGQVLRRYVKEWIVGVEDVTSLAHAISAAVERRDATLPAVPAETEYPLPEALRRVLGYD